MERNIQVNGAQRVVKSVKTIFFEGGGGLSFSCFPVLLHSSMCRLFRMYIL